MRFAYGLDLTSTGMRIFFINFSWIFIKPEIRGKNVISCENKCINTQVVQIFSYKNVFQACSLCQVQLLQQAAPDLAT